MKHLLSFLFLLIYTTAYAQIGKVYPKDESLNDPSLMQFITDLKVAVQEKDRAFIERSLASKTYTTNEGLDQTTKEGFMKYYFSTAPNEKESGIWSTFEFIFKIGGGGFSKDQNEYYLPYTSANIYEDNDMFDSFGLLIALSDSTPVYEKPEQGSKIVKFLSYDVVPETYEWDRYTWYQVILANDDTAYVNPKDFIPTLSIRAGLIKEDGLWKIQYADGFD
ncbi:hypothetical protein [Flammeovirga aprica]|uniref:Uncharacterized protein n=1 Tax=Flammeovirga aprica JL-4 TaxID=694437 RepID=A0A7X9S000_9BACT|nr:hypothetical protein [Flammeovirga aprica]NME71739.1 hypothetical protein [Flammeovirga aprica JL-4]